MKLEEINELWDRMKRDEDNASNEDKEAVFEYIMAARALRRDPKLFRLFFFMQADLDEDKGNEIISRIGTTFELGRYLHTLIDDKEKAQKFLFCLLEDEDDIMNLM